MEKITDSSVQSARAPDEATLTDATADQVNDTRQSKEPNQPEFVRTVTGFKWVLVVFAILSSTFLFALDNTVVADVQPMIVLEFNEIQNIAWLSVAFIMAATSTNLLFGQLYSHFNQKWLYIGSVVLFEAGSAVCGAAPTMDALIVGRALCGLGGIGMYLGVMSLIASTTGMQERPMYIAATGLTWGLGTILGPVVGGAFADSDATWRWAFYINLPIGALAGPVYLFLLPSPDPQPGATFKERISEIDYVGAPLMLAAIITFTMGISFGGVLYEWDSGSEIALFVVAGVLFVAFGFQQAYCIGTTKERRIFPVDLMTSRKSARTLILMFVVTAAGGTAIFVPVYFIPLFFQFTRGDKAVEAAVRLLPFIILLVVVTLAQGAVLSHPSGKYGLYMPWFTVGGAIAVAAGSLMFVVDSDTSVAWVYGSSAMLGAGVGTFTQSGFSIAQASVAESMGSVAAAYIALAQTGGITIALAIANAVFLNHAESRLRDILPSNLSDDQIQLAIAGVGGDFIDTLPAKTQQAIVDAIVEAMSLPYILVITAGAMVLVASLLMKRERLFLKVTAGGA